jgi:hypothetical protein
VRLLFADYLLRQDLAQSSSCLAPSSSGLESWPLLAPLDHEANVGLISQHHHEANVGLINQHHHALYAQNPQPADMQLFASASALPRREPPVSARTRTEVTIVHKYRKTSTIV